MSSAQPQGQGELEQTRRAYQDAAAVLTTFTPSALHPLGHTPDSDALDAFLDDCQVIYDAEQTAHFTLRDEVRAAALGRLGSRERLTEALAANPARPNDESQRALDGLILGSAPPLAQLSRSQLSATLQAVTWLGPVLPDAPDPARLRARIELDALLQPFRHLADAHFRGRRRDLALLQRYIDGTWPAPAAPGTAHPPLMVFGVGGIGKSTLLAKCLLELAARPEAARIPFVHLDFDRPDILAEEPVTLLIDALAQLAAQSPPDQTLFRGVRESWLRLRLERSRHITKGRQITRDALSEAFNACEEFVRFYASSSLAGRPLLIVLDTFEEVQRRSAERVGDVMGLLERLRAGMPALRPVLVGRVRLEEYPSIPLRLEGLGLAAAREVLESYGKLTPELARTVVRQVGRSPLALRLAAGLLQRERAAGRDITGGVQLDRFIRAARDLLLEGQLYWRILDHVGDADDPVRQLAHPGLVLRRVTPELIREVLAAPCGLDVPDDATARALFAKLRSAVDLVSEPEPDLLEHRPDVRKVMLELLRQDKKERVQAIHEAAVRYYMLRNGVTDRAEELYHRLMLNEAPAALDARWLPGVDQYLRDAVDELPHQAQNYLAGRIPEINLSGRIRALARLEDWERQALQRASERAAKGHHAQALAILGERRQRSAASPLYLLEAQLRSELGELDAARTVVAAGISAHSRRGSSRALLDLLLLAAHLAEQLGDRTGLVASLADAQLLIQRYGDDQRRLDLGLLQLRAARQDGAVAPPDAEALASLAVSILRPQAGTNPVLLREAAIELGRYQPELLRWALTSTDVELASSEDLVALVKVVNLWSQGLERTKSASLPLQAPLQTATPQLLRDTLLLQELLSFPPPSAVLEAVTDLLRPQTIELVQLRSYSRGGPQVRGFAAAELRYEDDLTESLFGSSPGIAYGVYQLERRSAGAAQRRGEPLGMVYLFNLAVAVAWRLDAEELAAIYRAFCGASALLYERSGGQMAIGQLLFGGPELVDVVDVQIWPSNRLEPTAEPWGLHDQRGVTPIWLGRSYWSAERGQEQPWDTPEGHSALADLWVQYVLGPQRGLVQQTLTAANVTHELYLHGDKVRGLYREPNDELTRAVFPELRRERAMASPPALPGNLPLLRRLAGFGVAAPDSPPLQLRGAELPPEVVGKPCWIYLKHEAAAQHGSLASTIGGYGERQLAADDQAELPGAEGGGTLALVSTAGAQPAVWRAELVPTGPAQWQRADPPRWDGALIGNAMFPQVLGARRKTLRYQPNAVQLVYNQGFAWRSGNALIPFEFNRVLVRSGTPLVIASADGGAVLMHPELDQALQFPPDAYLASQSDARQPVGGVTITRTHWLDATPPAGAQISGPVYGFALPGLVPGVRLTLLLRAPRPFARPGSVRVCVLNQGIYRADHDLWPLPEELRWEPLPTLARGGRQFAAPLQAPADDSASAPVTFYVALCTLSA